MPTELHLAEDPLALHLLLQHFEGLVDIVVADENLHTELLFDLDLWAENQAARTVGITGLTSETMAALLGLFLVLFG